jgi:hypothetical protein
MQSDPTASLDEAGPRTEPDLSTARGRLLSYLRTKRPSICGIEVMLDDVVVEARELAASVACREL